MTTYSKETALYDTGAIANDIGTAGETASKYITGIGDDGIKVHPYNETTGAVDQNNYNKIDANGMEVYQDGTSMASFGTSSRIGTEDGARLELTSDGLTAYSDDSSYFAIDYDSGTTSTEVKKGRYIKLTTLPVASGIPSASSTYLIGDVSWTVPSGATNIYIPKTVTAIYVNTHRANYSSTGTNNGYTLKSSSGTHVSYVLSSNVSLTYGTAISNITKTLLINFSSSVTVGIRQVISFDGQTARFRSYACQNTSGSISEFRVNPPLYYTTTVNAPSFVLGTNSDTLGIFSCSIGQGLTASGANQLVTGKYNASDTSKALIIGKGTSDSSRSNSFTVDWNGNAEAAGDYYSKVNQISLGTYITGGVLTGGGSYMHFSIPTGRVFPDGTTISKLTFNIVVRAGNHNASGLYIVKNASGGTDVKYYDSTASFQFYNGANQSKTLTTAMSYITLQGGTNIYVLWQGSGDYFFSGTSTYNGYVNNQPIVIMLTNITATLNIPS